jgi:GNAT superfamily N-acetyltransferase
VAGEPAIVLYCRGRHGDGPWRVVKAVFDEYGFPFDENDYDADVLRPEVHYNGKSGWFFVAEKPGGDVVGCIGLTNDGDGLFELHRLYVLKEARKGGLGGHLVRQVIELASKEGATELVLFSDIAFTDAHRLYVRSGFHNNRFRYAPDPWESREWGFTMDVTRWRDEHDAMSSEHS